MEKLTAFRHRSRGQGRPQILLIGNGLERKSGQAAWGELLNQLTVGNSLPVSQAQRERIPFPLLYQILSTPLINGFPDLSRDAILDEEHRLKDAMGQLTHRTNEFLDTLPSLNADHIFTTNYSYCIEQAFFPSADFSKGYARSRRRFRLKEPNTSRPSRENHYRLRTGYLAKSLGGYTGLWHIHGECAVPGGIVLSHDRYGRLLQRVEVICRSQNYAFLTKSPTAEREFTSWPELFLYGDVYILGLTLGEGEFDLWWLLRRKQRELYADGRIFFYEPRPAEGFQEGRHLLLQATGAELCDLGFTKSNDYDAFYRAAIKDIRQRIAASRPLGSA